MKVINVKKPIIKTYKNIDMDVNDTFINMIYKIIEPDLDNNILEYKEKYESLQASYKTLEQKHKQLSTLENKLNSNIKYEILLKNVLELIENTKKFNIINDKEYPKYKKFISNIRNKSYNDLNNIYNSLKATLSKK